MTAVIAPSIIAPLRPRGASWEQIPLPTGATLGFAGEAWRCTVRGIAVISAVEVAKDKDGIDRGPEYHLSMSMSSKRAPRAVALDVLEEFGLEGAEEDNHVPHGKVRNFWRPVADHLVGSECACKDAEMPQREDKGDYIWRPA